MEKENIYDDPNQKERLNTKTEEEQTREEMDEEGVLLYNDDGTPMDTSERTYVSVDLPEEEESSEEKDGD